MLPLEVTCVGFYKVELNVSESQGTSACEPLIMDLTARATKALVVDLTWDTPADLDPTDANGTDLDLHLLEPGAMWNGPGDCYFKNQNVDWGVGGIASDDCVLDRDDIDGFGPEVIEVDQPATTSGGNAFYPGPYTIGVYYYDGHNRLGPSYAKLRVFVGVDAAPIEWPSGEMTPIDTEGDSERLGRRLDVSGNGVQAPDGQFWIAGEIEWNAGAIQNANSIKEIDIVSTGIP